MFALLTTSLRALSKKIRHPPNPNPYCILGLDALQPYPPRPKRPDCQYMHQAAPADTKKEFP